MNDLYGYAKGDEILLCLAHCLGEQIDSSCDFVGHIGGDDFMLVISSNDWAARVKQLFETFERRCRSFYRAEHLIEGCFIAEGRQGGQQRYPLLSLSVGAVHLKPDPPAELGAARLASLASEAKRQAKQDAGFSLYTIDVEQRLAVDQSPSLAASAL
ncbi:diguanylate cyclase domain-containing protein [Pseudomonas sp. SST3]|uniref:diguanylate cyclase domain-containing protein n=1 Tax=Pseudomonas sp. SST3 TaxID=2267882 RepID=UPI0026C4936B